MSAGPTFGQSNGTVTATVQVQAAACITINPTSFAYPASGLSTASALNQVVPAVGTNKPVATNCSSVSENFLAQGAAATGQGAIWQLVQSIDCTIGNTNQYRHDVRLTSGSFGALSTTDQTWQSNIPANNTKTLDTQLTMPCTGSDGVSVTMSMPIVITAVVQ
ncbi:MAG: hypothetical protein ACRDJE_02940 [Dehalococcoidia bacterium]